MSDELVRRIRALEDRASRLVSTVDQLQAEVDRRDDTLLDVVAVLALGAIAVLVADLMLRQGAA